MGHVGSIAVQHSWRAPMVCCVATDRMSEETKLGALYVQLSPYLPNINRQQGSGALFHISITLHKEPVSWTAAGLHAAGELGAGLRELTQSAAARSRQR